MSKSAKAYGAAALVLIFFPLFLAFWSSTSAIIAILLIGTGAYSFAVCLLIASFWHRYHYGTWPVEIKEDPTQAARYSYASLPAEESTQSIGQERKGEVPGSDGRFKANHLLQHWLRYFSSNV